jgi:hypothetical protein
MQVGGVEGGQDAERGRTVEDQDMEDASDDSSSNSERSVTSGMETVDKGKGRATEDVDMGDAPESQSGSAVVVNQSKRVATPSSLSSLSSGSIFALSPAPKKAKPDSATQNWRVLPRDYMQCSPRDLGLIIADMLGELIQINDEMPPKGILTRFHSR